MSATSSLISSRRSAAVAGTAAVVGEFGTSAGAGGAAIDVKGSSGWPATPAATLLDPAAGADDFFGSAVAAWGTTALIGAADTQSGAGAAYVYEL